MENEFQTIGLCTQKMSACHVNVKMSKCAHKTRYLGIVYLYTSGVIGTGFGVVYMDFISYIRTYDHAISLNCIYFQTSKNDDYVIKFIT